MTASPIRIYLYKLFILFPFTFLFAPIFWRLLIYNPNPASGLINSAFPFIIYIWYAFFIYFGMAAALILKKYKFLAYPVIITAAFLARYIVNLPVFDWHKTLIFRDELGVYSIIVPIDADELAYLMLVLFISTMIAGCFSAAYAKKTAVDFMKRGNTFLFLHIAVLGGLFHGSAIYIGLFAASYFIARNFILISRELEVYSEKGAYNTSGVRRIIAYYFCMTVIFTVAPVIICAVIVPFIIENIINLSGALLRRIITAILEYERDLPDLEEVELEAGELPEWLIRDQIGNDNELIIYYIVMAVFFIIIFIFRKWFIKIIKEFIELLKTKANLYEYDRNKVINQELITELPKEKAKKGRAAYKNYIKTSRRIDDVSRRFLFAYNCLHWEFVRKGSELKESLTPRELTAIFNETYDDLARAANLYEDIKYGIIAHSDDLLRDMTEKTEIMLERVLLR